MPTAVTGITCCYGYLVTMATEAGAYNIAVLRYMNFSFGTQIPCANSSHWCNLLLWIPVTMATEADTYNITSYLVHTFLEATGISGITCWYGALLPWQQKHAAISGITSCY